MADICRYDLGTHRFPKVNSPGFTRRLRYFNFSLISFSRFSLLQVHNNPVLKIIQTPSSLATHFEGQAGQ